MKFRSLLIFIILAFQLKGYSQVDINQNGISTSVTNALSASGTQAKRYQIATIGFNSHHWQHTGIIVIELFNVSFSTSYSKYVLEVGYKQGTDATVPKLTLVEAHGKYPNAKITLGDIYNLATSYSGYPNVALPVYLDVKYYSTYRARITYEMTKVDDVTSLGQIKIDNSPTATNISDFTVDIVDKGDIISSGLLRISGSGDHYIANGNVGIGCTTPDAKLTVNGTIKATRIDVTSTVPCSDYVFNTGYNLLSLKDLEQFVKTNKHLPEVPSAAEFKQNGYSVGNMDDILLRKVEELTLYTIEQDKQISEQDNKNTKLEEVIDKQQQLLKQQQKDLKKKDEAIYELLKRMDSLEAKMNQLQ